MLFFCKVCIDLYSCVLVTSLTQFGSYVRFDGLNNLSKFCRVRRACVGRPSTRGTVVRHKQLDEHPPFDRSQLVFECGRMRNLKVSLVHPDLGLGEFFDCGIRLKSY